MRREPRAPAAILARRPGVSRDTQDAGRSRREGDPGDDARLSRALVALAPAGGGGLPTEEAPISEATTRPRIAVAPGLQRAPQDPAELAAEVAAVLAGMTYEERVRAYRSGALTAHELALAAGRLPDQMPILNGEFEWIAYDLE